MEERFFNLLEKVYKKLDGLEKIEKQFSEQNDRIKDLEKFMKKISDKNDQKSSCNIETEQVTSKKCSEENFINQMRADVENIDYKETSLKRDRSKVKKSASFQKRRTQRSLKERRKIHTVPSDKDEERRLKSFRRECLSKAIQWNIVDLLKVTTGQQIINMPKWLIKSEIEMISQGSDQKNHLRRFLCILINKDFDTMRQWLQDCKLDEKVIEKIWRTFEEFSDIETNRQRMKCFHCRLLETENVLDVVDHLFSADIISQQLCMQISQSQSIVGAQENLWKSIMEECRQYIYPKAIVSAFRIAIADKMSKVAESEKDSHESLLNFIDEVDSSDILDCHCQERCSKNFHPLSCLKSMSLAGIYFSPPTRRKSISSTATESPPSSLSSIDSIDEETKGESENPTHDSSSYCDETSLKKPDIPPRVPIENKSQNRSLTKTMVKVPTKSQKVLRRTSKQNDLVPVVESSSESLDGEDKPPLPARHSFRTVNNMSSNRQENNPNVISAHNVYFDTGPKYYIKRRNIERSSSSGSSS